MNPILFRSLYLKTTYEPELQPELKLIFADRKGGFPHSEIFGSKGARASPKLIAACHVLHRLSTPRHPSEALMRLIVLSKTHAWGRFARSEVRSPLVRPYMTLCICQTMMSSQGHPSKRREAPGKPFHSRYHSSRRPGLAARERKPVIRCDRAKRRLGGARRDRTDDLMLAKHALYQLSYGP